MFYVPWNGNGATLDSLCRMIDSAALDKGSIKVDGYSGTKRLSMIRCNRVKSELITRKGLREEHFTTTNNVGEWHGQKNVVLVTLPSLHKMETEKRQDVPKRETSVLSDKPVLTDTREQPETTTVLEREKAKHAGTLGKETEPIEATGSSREENIDFGTLFLRANLLRWATLTPDLGIEWCVSSAWSVQLNGAYTSWGWDNGNRRYALWEISPEVRYYMGMRKQGYVGLMYHVGGFNYKLGNIGKQGNLTGGGVTGGYLLPLNRMVSLDFSLGIGCTCAEYDKYTLINGVRVKQGKVDKDYWGMNRLGISLIWTIF